MKLFEWLQNFARLIAYAVVVVFAVIGMYHVWQQFGRGDRAPSSIAKVYDFSHLDGDALREAMRDQLLHGANIIHKKDQVGIQLGHFVTHGASGQPQFACDIYDKITLTFEAEGVAVEGAKPKIEVEGKCEVNSKNANKMLPIWIPFVQLMKERPGSREMTLMGEKPLRMVFQNFDQDWPKHWVLSKVKLSAEKTAPTEAGAVYEEDLVVQHREILQVLQKPLSMHWD